MNEIMTGRMHDSHDCRLRLAVLYHFVTHAKFRVRGTASNPKLNRMYSNPQIIGYTSTNVSLSILLPTLGHRHNTSGNVWQFSFAPAIIPPAGTGSGAASPLARKSWGRCTESAVSPSALSHRCPCQDTPCAPAAIRRSTSGVTSTKTCN